MPHGSTDRQDQPPPDEQLDAATPATWWDRYHTILKSQLSGRHKLAMLVIAGYAGDANECWASTRTIATALPISSAAAGRTIKELHDAGFLDRVPRKHSPSILRVCWQRFGVRLQPAQSSIDDSDDRRLRSPQPANAQVDTTYKNTKVNTPSKEQAGARFVPPTVDEVAAYCRERGISIDPDRFVDHYTANGWRCGRTPMKDWQAAVRNWERNDAQFRTGQAKPQAGQLFDLQGFLNGGDE